MVGLLQFWQSRKYGPMDAMKWVERAIQSAELQGFKRFHVSYDQATEAIQVPGKDHIYTQEPGLSWCKITVHGS